MDSLDPVLCGVPWLGDRNGHALYRNSDNTVPALLEPGLTLRLTLVVGHVMMNIPIIIVVSAFCSLFSLVAGICMHGILKRTRTCKTDR